MRLQNRKLLFHCLLLLRRMTVADGTVEDKHVGLVQDVQTVTCTFVGKWS